jgi:hypothetical protein
MYKVSTGRGAMTLEEEAKMEVIRIARGHSLLTTACYGQLFMPRAAFT